jgi:hypothetical protein
VAEGFVIGNLVRLYRALGGGWDPNAADPDAQENVPTEENRQVALSKTADTAS